MSGFLGARCSGSNYVSYQKHVTGSAAMFAAKCLVLIAGILTSTLVLGQSTFVSMTPERLLDTRPGYTTIDGQFQGTGIVTGGGTGPSIDLTIVGRPGIPASGVGAVALNITVLGATSPTGGFLVAYPSGTTKPTASNLNFAQGQSISNQVVVQVGTNGKVSIFLSGSAGLAHIVADVTGYFPTTSNLTSFSPMRLLDTRTGGTTIDGLFAGGGPISGGSTLNLTVLGRDGGVIPSAATGVVINFTATSPHAQGYATIWPTGSARPNASNISFDAGQTIPNLVTVAPGTSGQVSIFISSTAGYSDMIADIVGYFTSSATFVPLVPARLLDTRPGFTTIDGLFQGGGALTAGASVDLTVLGRGSVPSSGVDAVALNVTATSPLAAGFITGWDTGSTQPVAMDLNFATGNTIASLSILKVGAGGKVSLANNSPNSTQLIADVVGWFPSGTCSGLAASPIFYNFESGGGSQSLAVTAPAGCTWTLTNSNSWLTVSPSSGTGNGAVTLTTSTNTTTANFTGSITLAGTGASPTTITVLQTQKAVVSDAAVPVAIPSLDSTSDAVGATAAQFRVDEGGNATYSIPIQVSPGTAGMTPKLALSYNSRLPEGVMGPGWTIDGASQITRCRQTRESGDFGQNADGDPLPVNFTSSDRFCLDGVRLLLTSSGSYGDTGTTYSPETDPTTKVTVTTGANGPSSFSVQRKDGTTSSYGSTTDSLQTAPKPNAPTQTVNVSWNLARVTDSAGNYMTYSYYQQPAGSTYGFAASAVESTLKEVDYTGNSNTVPPTATYASVLFSYTPLSATQARLGYQGGVAFVQTQKLSGVTVQNGSTVIRYYNPGYGNAASGSGFPILTSITECRDSTGTAVCFKPTLFNWSQAQTTFQTGTSSTSSVSFTNQVGYKVADIDGDGRQDYVWAVNDGVGGCTHSNIYVGFSDVDGSGNMTTMTVGQAPKCAPIDLTSKPLAWYLVDVDGDGRADLLVGDATLWHAYASVGRPSSGQPVFGTTDLLASLSIGVTSGAPAAILADLNGDGLPDLITPSTLQPYEFNTFPRTGQADSGLTVRFMQRSGTAGAALTFSAPVEIYLTFADSTCDVSQQVQCSVNFFNTNVKNGSAIANDVNGDGRTDLTFLVEAIPCDPCQEALTETVPRLKYDPTLGVPSTSNQAAPTPSIGGTFYWYQFAADGIDSTDFSQPVEMMKQYIKLSPTVDASLPTNLTQMFVVDMTGDGLTDLVWQDASPSNPTTYHVLVNNGSGYQGTSVTLTGISNSSQLQFADLNADGITDMVFPTSSSPYSNYQYKSLVLGSSGWTATSATSVPGTGMHNDTSGSTAWVSMIGDFDGDGAPDFLSVRTTTGSGSNLYTSRSASTSRYQPRDVVTKITNGLSGDGNGAWTQLNYQPLTNSAVYQRGGMSGYPAVTNAIDYGWAAPVFDVLAPMYVVGNATSLAPTQSSATATSTIWYRYAGATMQAGGRGFLGFYEAWAFDGNDAATSGKFMVTLTRYAQRYPLIGMPISTLRQAFTGTAVTFGTTTLNNCATNIESGGCFVGVTGSGTSVTSVQSWPDYWSVGGSPGTYISLSLQLPICAGPGCLMSVSSTACSVNLNGENPSAAPPVAPPGDFTESVFTGPAAAGPVFSYTQWTKDLQYDFATGNPRPQTAEVDNNFCYDGNGSTAGVGNLTGSLTTTLDNTGTAIGEKATENTFSDDTSGTHWYLGRMTQSVVTFAKPSQTDVVRTTQFGYDSGTGLLTSEKIIGSGTTAQVAQQSLKTFYTLNTFGERTAAYQCSNDLSDALCKNVTSFVQQQPSGTHIHRYAKTTYDSVGRYSTSSAMPFTDVSGNRTEKTAVTIQARDEFGNPVQQLSLNDTSGFTVNSILTTQYSKFGAMGRPYFAADNTGKATTTTYRFCGTGTGQVGCSSDTTRFKFRSQTVTTGAPTSWTYYDILGRPVLQVAQTFDGNSANGQYFSGTCSYVDAHNRTTYQSEPFFLTVGPNGDGSPALTSGAASPCASATNSTTMAYDVLGRVITITQPDASVINKTYTGLTSTASNPRNASWIASQTVNALGEVVQTIDPSDTSKTGTGGTGIAATGMTVTMTYEPAGNVSTIVRDGGSGTITSSFAYDIYGRKTSQVDPDTGSSFFTYNGAGELTQQQDNEGQIINLSYDAMGRKWQRATASAHDGNDITDNWNFDTASNGYGQLASEARSSSATLAFKRTLSYDVYGRLSKRVTKIGANTYGESTAYDSIGRMKSQQDASGYSVASTYTANGYVSQLTDSRFGTLYELLTTTKRGQVASDRRGGSSSLLSTLTYNDQTGRLNTVCSGTSSCNLQDLQYLFDYAGNLTARTRAYHGAQTAETFTYDALNRLLNAQLVKITGSVPSPIPTLTLTYDKLGNICTKTPISSLTVTYQYAGLAGCTHFSGGSPHAVIYANTTGYGYDGAGNQTTSDTGRAISYNAFNQVTRSVENDVVVVSFQYGPDGDRFVRTDSDTGIETYYIGKTEIRVSGSSMEARRYLSTAIDYVRTSGSNETRYTFSDHLGSMDVIASSSGTALENLSFDAHGNRRDPTTWEGSASPAVSTTMGFTAQEHVDSQAFIHMNGRIYDPTLGKMLQADPVTNPGSQGLNRYSYVANNPLSLTDPTGYSWWRIIASVAIAIFAPYAWPVLQCFWGAVAVGFVSGYVATGSIQGALVGAFTAGVFYGIGEAFQNASWANASADDIEVGNTGLNIIGFSAKVLAHGIAGGVVSELQGGRFGSGFASAGVTEVFSPVVDTVHDEADRVIAAALIGGTSSVVAGGKFENGAITAAFAQVFNDSEHRAFRPAPGTTITVNGNNVDIQMRNYYFGDGATPDNIARVNAAIEKAWSGSIGDYNVTTTVESISGNEEYNNDVNLVNLSNSDFRSYVQITNNSAGTLYDYLGVSRWSMGGKSWTADESVWAHEAGHLMGLPDFYTDIQFDIGGLNPAVRSMPWAAHANDIMASRRSAVTGFDIESIISLGK